MQSQVVTAPTETHPARASARLYYLDWLRVLAIVGVFFFHAVHPFDYFDWHIKNGELSMTVTVVLALLFPWGMPFFFLIAGTGSWFALRRRTAGQYVGERVKRLLIPYITGCILLWPIMLYYQWRHILSKGDWYGSFLDFVLFHRAGFSPMWFGEVGFHLWFLAFLFCFSVLGLPLFLWLKGQRGQAALARSAEICAHRGGILVFIVPLLLVRLVLQPLFPQEHDWADFFFLMALFVCGFILYAHEGFARAIRRDGLILLVAAIVTSVGWAYLGLTAENLDVEAPIRTGRQALMWAIITANAWCWSVFLLSVGMRALDFTNQWLVWGQEAVLPFFLLHQPVIMVVAYYVVQWHTGIFPKLLTVVIASLLITLSLYEFVIRRVSFLRKLFGMKASARKPVAQPGEAALLGPGETPQAQ
jgi:peptidoglycan/LPS O-acetylase OafA/YrhL